MKKEILNRMILRLRLCIAALLLVILSLFLFSFTMHKIENDFLKQLGLSKISAEEKITGSILSGSLDHYGIRNLKNILVNDRAAIVKDIAAYARQHLNSTAFKNEYTALRNNNKPAPAQKVETPEEMRASMIKMAKEFIKKTEDGIKSASPDMKKVFMEMLETAKQNLKNAEDPANKTIKSYEKNYESMKKMMQQSYERSIQEWESKFPANHLQYVKFKLQDFLDATADIDFNAKLVEKNGIKYFANPAYEQKGNRWKLVYRAGKDAVEAGREYARQWMEEIK